MHRETVTKISVRMWSDTASLKPIAARLWQVGVFRDKGEDIVFSARGERRTRRSTENYLSTGDVEIADMSAVRVEVERQVRFLQDEPSISRLIDDGALEVVVWVAVFGNEGAARIEDLDIDLTSFGRGVGLVVENYTDFSVGGNPRKLVIESTSK